MKHARLGQHFLQDHKVLEVIIRAINPPAQETIFEIGTGSGILTKQLVQTKNKIVSIEKDPELFALAKQWQQPYSNLTVTKGDVLRFKPDQYISGPWSIVGNIPYYLTGKLLRLIIEQWPVPRVIILMIQKEVAERLTDKSRFSKLSVFGQLYGNIDIIKHVPPNAFKPAPKIWSSIVKIKPHQIIPPEINEPEFKNMVTKSFFSPRKYLANNLKAVYPAEQIIGAFTWLKIPSQIRAESITPPTWIKLYRCLGKKNTD